MSKLKLSKEPRREFRAPTLNDLSQEATYPELVCRECLERSGGRQMVNPITSTKAVCGLCGEDKACYEPKDFGYPFFDSETRKGALRVGMDFRTKDKAGY